MRIQEFVEKALHCSVFVSPRSPGLTRQELFEVGERLDFGRGEISDQLRMSGTSLRIEGERYVSQSVALGIFAFTFEGDPRDGAAADFVVEELKKIAREVGRGNARLGRDELVARAVANGHEAHDVDVAIAVLTTGGLSLDGSDVVLAGYWANQSPSYAKQQSEANESPRPYFDRLFETVRDVIERRDTRLPKSIEPIQAFGELLEPLGYQEKFGAWWAHIAGEMRRADPRQQPVMVVVLAVALAEGALALICRHAHKTGKTMTKGINLDNPKQWKFATLVAAARKGPEEAGRLLDDALASRCMDLNERRQAIHVGRLLVDYDKFPTPDIRPGEAREAKMVLELLLRRILDWYESNPVESLSD